MIVHVAEGGTILVFLELKYIADHKLNMDIKTAKVFQITKKK